ncbi:hypothetical protein D558_1786 [Bordetella holmesii 44057]|nr:hypothetical protein D558_1786 [Bordetella holmesii 44057]EWM47029.1 hypothetical protein D555_1812 [Bordetella holmesii 35009]
MRDVLLGHYPLTWVVHPEYLAMTAGAALLTALCAHRLRHLRKVFLLLDALGLVAFTVIGCKVAQQMELSLPVIMITGVITGCAGGVLRDVLCNDIPLLFRSELYASVSVVTASVYLALDDFTGTSNLAVPAALAGGWPCVCWRCALIGRCPSSSIAVTGTDTRPAAATFCRAQNKSSLAGAFVLDLGWVNTGLVAASRRRL